MPSLWGFVIDNKLRDDQFKELASFGGCFSGDCPHEKQVGCFRDIFNHAWDARDKIAYEEVAYVAGSCAGATARKFQDEINELLSINESLKNEILLLSFCVKDFRETFKMIRQVNQLHHTMDCHNHNTIEDNSEPTGYRVRWKDYKCICHMGLIETVIAKHKGVL